MIKPIFVNSLLLISLRFITTTFINKPMIKPMFYNYYFY